MLPEIKKVFPKLIGTLSAVNQIRLKEVNEIIGADIIAPI
jgi:hypothetical protein